MYQNKLRVVFLACLVLFGWLIQPVQTPSPALAATFPAGFTDTILFSVGQTIVITGKATDPLDDTLPPSALTWSIIRHHGTGFSAHTHPFLDIAGVARVNITAPPCRRFAHRAR